METESSAHIAFGVTLKIPTKLETNITVSSINILISKEHKTEIMKKKTDCVPQLTAKVVLIQKITFLNSVTIIILFACVHSLQNEWVLRNFSIQLLIKQMRLETCR